MLQPGQTWDLGDVMLRTEAGRKRTGPCGPTGLASSETNDQRAGSTRGLGGLAGLCSPPTPPPLLAGGVACGTARSSASHAPGGGACAAAGHRRGTPAGTGEPQASRPQSRLEASWANKRSVLEVTDIWAIHWAAVCCR